MGMCGDLVENDGFQSSSSSLASTWHDGMIWFGPSGIGATYTIERYQLQHQGAFRAGLRNIDFNGHVLEHAEGCYGGWFGWPNMRMNQGDGFMGCRLPSAPPRCGSWTCTGGKATSLRRTGCSSTCCTICGCWGWMRWGGLPGCTPFAHNPVCGANWRSRRCGIESSGVYGLAFFDGILAVQ